MSGPNLRRLGLAGIGVAVAALVLTGALLARGRSSPPPAARQPAGTPAPELTGEDPITGKQVTLAAYAGKPVVINVWASWCPGCKEEANDLRRFAAAHPEAQLIGVDINDTRGAARAFYERYAWRHPSIFDPTGAKSDSLGVRGLPTTLFLNARHEIVARIVGESDFAGFEDGLRQAVTAQ